MLRYDADQARRNAREFQLKDFNAFKSRIEQTILDESNKGKYFAVINFDSSVIDEERLYNEVISSGYSCTIDDLLLHDGSNNKKVEISWADEPAPLPEENI